MNEKSQYPVIIVGGGIAGLTCGITLCKHGIKPLLLEKRPYLGGRAVTQPTTIPLDNSPHLISTAYQTLLYFLEEAGHPISFPRQSSVVWYDRNGHTKKITFQSSRIQFLISFLKSFSFSSYRSLIQIYLFTKGDAIFSSVEDWMTQKKLTPEVQDFIRLLTLSVLNVEPKSGDAQLLRTVLQKAIFDGYGQLLHITPITEKIIQPLSSYYLSLGGQLSLHEPVLAIQKQNELYEIQTSKQKYLSNEVVLALPQRQRIPILEEVSSRYSPIVSVRLLYENIPSGWWGEVDGDFDWVFVHTSIPQLVELVKSSADAQIQKSNVDLIQAGKVLVQKRLPNAIYLSSLGVVKEVYATPIQDPNWVQTRLPMDRTFQGCWIASDESDTGLPATMESAAIAGKSVAELIVNQF